MKYKTIFLFLTLLSLQACLSGDKKPTWLSSKPNEKVRFQIPVFEIESKTRQQNLDLTKDFALIWKEKTGYDYFIQDRQIINETLKAGQLIPSTNFQIELKFQDSKNAKFIKANVKDLETSEVVSSSGLKVISFEDTQSNFKNIIKELYQ